MKKVEVRRVAVDWEHPKGSDNNYIPLRDGLSYSGRVKLFEDGLSNWNPRSNPFYRNGLAYEDWAGSRPALSQHMPNWPKTDRKKLIMYDVSKNDGLPISPAFDRPEDLCRWLVENHVSYAGHVPAYDEWFEIATRDDDAEDDRWYDATRMIQAGMIAMLMGDEEKAMNMMKHLRAMQTSSI